MKKIFLFTLLLAMVFPFSVLAENYPYRSDVLWVTVPDHANWVYKTGEKATVEIQFYKYGIPQDGVTVNYELGGDMMPADSKGSVVLKDGKATIKIGTMKQPHDGYRQRQNLQASCEGRVFSREDSALHQDACRL